jgi:hypothetical protein
MKTRHLRRRAAEVERGEQAWLPRVMHRIPRFRWRARIKCQRRFVYVRESDESISMRRAICRGFRRISWPAHRDRKVA